MTRDAGLRDAGQDQRLVSRVSQSRVFLKFITITHRRNNREDARLHQHFALRVDGCIPLVVGVNDERIVVVVDIVDADVPRADAVFLLLVEVHAEVELVGAGWDS